MYRLKVVSEIFQNFTVGIGALFAGAAGFKVIWEFFSERKKANKINAWIKEYPRKGLNIDFELVHSPIPGQSNRVYILDFKTKMRYWVSSRQTRQDLLFSSDDEKNVKIDKFESYKEGENILTSGTPGF